MKRFAACVGVLLLAFVFSLSMFSGSQAASSSIHHFQVSSHIGKTHSHAVAIVDKCVYHGAALDEPGVRLSADHAHFGMVPALDGKHDCCDDLKPVSRIILRRAVLTPKPSLKNGPFSLLFASLKSSLEIISGNVGFGQSGYTREYTGLTGAQSEFTRTVRLLL